MDPNTELDLSALQEAQKQRRVKLLERVHRKHNRVDPCFMTGKGCVYTDQIDEGLDSRNRGQVASGFMIMPFRQNLTTFFSNSLVPFFRANFGVDDKDEDILMRGDEVRRPGVIICEGICKRIQESDFVIAEVSLPNANVFYEMGLAFGIRQKIVLVQHERVQSAKFSQHLAKSLPAGASVWRYVDLQPIDPVKFQVHDHLWVSADETPTAQVEPKIVLIELHLGEEVLTEMKGRRMSVVDRDATSRSHTSCQNELLRRVIDTLQAVSQVSSRTTDDIDLDFEAHVSSAVGLAVHRLCGTFMIDKRTHEVVKSHQAEIQKLQTVKPYVSKQGGASPIGFDTIRSAIDSAYCVIVRTGFPECDPMAYFWLGYGHARGKNVIPITAIQEAHDPVDDLAFDIRAQRHMTFIQSRPDLLEKELGEALKQMISSDFMKWSRKRFWDQAIGRRGSVHIFTGALHNTTFGREMIGDWDLRTASELASYLASQHYRATIESPVYPPERVFGQQAFNYPKERVAKEKEYVQRLIRLLENRNCIIIASPDVNPLTELVLGRVYNVAKGQGSNIDHSLLFNKPIAVSTYQNAVVAVKWKSEAADGDGIPAEGAAPHRVGRAFYREEEGGEIAGSRGFESNAITDGRIFTTFRSQTDKTEDFKIYSHLVVTANPFSPGHYIVVLNGVSGPATFALSQILTGGVSGEFVEYGDFDSQRESEDFLGRFLLALQEPKTKSVDAILQVDVGPAKEQDPTSDWRRIKGWRSVGDAFGHGGIRTIG
jgi:hypothetical protein